MAGEEPRASSMLQEVLPAGYALAGGASTRFGRDKALVELNGKSMLARTLLVLGESGVRETIVVGERKKYGRLGARCVLDKWPGEGPLGGIITALYRSLADKYGYQWSLIVSCDMPFLKREWLSYLIKRALASDAEVVVPQSAHGLEPLCACWRTSSLATLKKAFEKGTRKVTDAMKMLPMEILDEMHWKRFDIGGRLFWNMNTPKDYEDAARILEAERM